MRSDYVIELIMFLFLKNFIVGVEGFGPPNPKDQIYSLAQLTIVAALPYYSAPDGTRIHNSHIKSVVLCQLSYKCFLRLY